LKELDANGDGLISQSEFQALVVDVVKIIEGERTVEGERIVEGERTVEGERSGNRRG